jgi:SAM-dependent methyltransferase
MVLEHITNLMPLAGEIWRILRPDGVLVSLVPWWSSYRTWGDPTHVRAFNHQSFAFWSKKSYEENAEKGTTMGQYEPTFDFDPIHHCIVLNKCLEGKSPEEIDRAVTHDINTVDCLWVALQAVKPNEAS